MNKSIVALLLAGIGLAVVAGGTAGTLLGVLTLAAAGLFVTLRRYFPARHAGVAVGNLVVPSVGVGFAQHAQTTNEGEVLLPYQTYKQIHRRLTSSLWTMFGISILTLIGLKTLPVPAFVLFVPLLALFLGLALFSALSLFRLVPAGQRLATLKTMFFADPRLVFAQYAAHQPNGEVTVGYTTYKRLTRATGYVLATLLIGLLTVLASEVQQAEVASQENLDAASKQFQVLASSVLSGQGDLKEQMGKLLAQSLQPAPNIDENSLTNRILASVSKKLPEAPEQIVTNNQIEKTTIVNRDFIEPHTRQAIKLGEGSVLAYQDDNGTTFLNIGSGPSVTIPDAATLNVQGYFQLDGTTVTATANDLNYTSNLQNTDLANEGARYVNTRAADFTNFSPSRNDVQAALAAIDTSLGATTGSVSGFTPGSVLFANMNGTLTQDASNFYWDKANHRLGLGTTAPSNKLDVNGSAALGTYAGTAGPSNGLIVSGNVGIGTTAPGSTLEVTGNIALSEGVARTIKVNTSTTQTTGKDLTIQAGSAFNGGAGSLGGGNLIPALST